ncbi:MAG: YdcF family protein [Paracoccaceae bacterium]
MLPVLVSPVFVILLLAVISVLSSKRFPRVLLVILCLIFTSPIIAQRALQFAEQGQVRLPVHAFAKADTVIVLGGITRTIAGPDETLVYEMRDSVDRYLAALEMIRQDKVQRMILTRGQLPWLKGVPEGEHLATLAISAGVSLDRIALTDQAQNTEQEAANIRQMVADTESLILVTSAFHMPRAKAIFEAEGISVTPFPVDFRAEARRPTGLDFLPQAAAMDDISLVIRELLGRAYYRLKGSF